MTVYVLCDSVSGFEFTRETGVFDLVGVPLCHGWLVDPQNSCYSVVKDFSYNQLVEMVINDSVAQDTKLQQKGSIVGYLQHNCYNVGCLYCYMVLLYVRLFVRIILY